MMDAWIYIATALIFLFLGAVFFGAPYVPTRRRDVEKLFKLISKKDVLVDLGSGDGRLVRAAAAKGIKAYGIELSPILAFLSWLSLGAARKNVRIRWGNYWRMDLPADTTTVFVFLADPYMEKLRHYLEAESARLNRTLTLISYGFALPGHQTVKKDGALLVYEITP